MFDIHVLYVLMLNIDLENVPKRPKCKTCWNKPISSNVKTPKPYKLDNVPVNVVAIVITHNLQPKQHVLKEKESIKAKGAKDWQQKKCL